jgi:hypothetical protein
VSTPDRRAELDNAIAGLAAKRAAQEATAANETAQRAIDVAQHASDEVTAARHDIYTLTTSHIETKKGLGELASRQSDLEIKVDTIKTELKEELSDIVLSVEQPTIQTLAVHDTITLQPVSSQTRKNPEAVLPSEDTTKTRIGKRFTAFGSLAVVTSVVAIAAGVPELLQKSQNKPAVSQQADSQPAITLPSEKLLSNPGVTRQKVQKSEKNEEQSVQPKTVTIETAPTVGTASDASVQTKASNSVQNTTKPVEKTAPSKPKAQKPEVPAKSGGIEYGTESPARQASTGGVKSNTGAKNTGGATYDTLTRVNSTTSGGVSPSK